MAKAIRISFVVPKECSSETQCNEEMQQAFMACKQNSMNIQWVKEDNILNESWKKTDVLVFQNFEGQIFNEVKSKKSVRIVGPWCLLTCITEGKSIPNVSWPVYNVAMYNCYVACSHLPKAEKREIEELVQKMGGHYTGNLMEATTHLVTDTVKSEKYSKAAECGLKIMLSSWVTEVWKSSCKANVNGNDSEFDKYRCPPFHNLVICCTGFSQITERRKIEDLVKNYGGTFKGQLQLSTTDILICEKGSTSSAKYKAAKKSKTIKCVSLDWLTCSIEKGYALPDNLYPVEVGTSTPTKEGNNPLPDFSMISNITVTSTLGVNSNTLADSLNVASPNLTTNNKANGTSNETKKRKSASNEWDDLVEQIDLKKVKMAGAFLDGCSIYLAGFSSEQKDKLCKVLNFGGAMRYDDVSDRITHAIVGDPLCHDLRLIQNGGLTNHFPLLNLHWLIDSIEKKHPVPEEHYIVNVHKINDNEPKSPLSKKGLFLLRSNTPKMEESTEIKQKQRVEQQPEIDHDSELLQQYLQPESSRQDTLAQLLKNASGTFSANSENNLDKKTENKEKSVNSNSKHSEGNSPNSLQPFNKMKFILTDIDEEDFEDIQSKIEECGGSIVPESYKGIPDYIVAPIFLPSLKIKKPSCEVVSVIYILECFETKELIELDYYHRPMFIESDTKPLSGKVVTISSYSGYERLFLRYLIEELGGVSQDQFARVTSISKNIIASTHLVSSEASGKKYEAALKWKLPVVNKDWLIKSAQKGELEPEQPYLMGEAKGMDFSDSTLVKMKNSTAVVPSTSKYSTPTKNFNEINENPCTPKSTPKNSSTKRPQMYGTSEVNTPVTGKVFSQVTPVSKIMEEVRMTNLLGTPECPTTPKPWNYVTTPDTPLGAFIKPNPSPALRKELAQWINTLPDWQPPPQRRPSTPLSELKRQLWNKVLPSNQEISSQLNFQSDTSGKENEMAVTPNKKVTSSNAQETPESVMVKNQLQQIQVMLTSSGSKHNSKRRESTIPETAPAGRAKDSQANTIGWDDTMDGGDFGNFTETNKPPPIIMLSGVPLEEKDEMVKCLTDLGAMVSSSINFDPECTHLICPKPLRNEKILACMASGKWILHTSYITECIKAGKLIDEEPFEYGNPKSKDNPEMPREKELEARMEAMHWWRREISRRGYGPFHDMRAIVVALKKEPITRVIQAGGGVVVDASPPFPEHVHATHCFLEARAVSDYAVYIPLAEQGIYCLNTVYISEFLHRTASDVRNSVMPYYAKFYTNTFRD